MIWQSLLLGVHLVCVNLAAAGPLVAPVLLWPKGAAGDAAVARIGRQLLALSMLGLVLGGAVGMLSGWMLWNTAPDRVELAMSRLSSKIFFGMWELAFYVVCLAGCWAWWSAAPPRGLASRLGLALLAWLAATNLLWHFPPLMTIFAQLLHDSPTSEAISSAEFRTLMFAGPTLSRCVHVWLASLATSGMALALLGVRERRGSETPQPFVERAIASGARIALVATLVQMLVGAWVFFTSPAIEQTQLMGGNWLATLLLVVSIAAALWLLHLLGSMAVGPAESKQVITSAIVMAGIIFAMSATLIVARGPTTNEPHEPPHDEQSAQRTPYSSPSRIWQ